jgi:Lipopolysaccharide-assembly
MNPVPLVMLLFLLGACANYRMGSTPKSQETQDVRILYVPTASNETDESDVSAPVTNAVLQEIDRDGTFRHARKDESDAVLEITIKKIQRSPIQQSVQQYLTTLQYQLTLILEYRLYSLKNKKEAIARTEVRGDTTFFVQGDQTESQRQALPLAAQSAAKNLITNLANRGW